MAIEIVTVEYILRNFVPGSYDQPWSWEDEARDLLSRICLCCGKRGHYQLALEDYLRERGGVEQGVLLGCDGRMWDGHHRTIGAWRLGYTYVPLEDPMEHLPELKPCRGGRWRIACTCGKLRDRRRFTTREAALRIHIAHVEEVENVALPSDESA